MTEQKVAVITGVGPGLGASLVRRFAGNYAVAIMARRADYIKGLAGEIRRAGGSALDISCDVSDRSQINSFVDLGLLPGESVVTAGALEIDQKAHAPAEMAGVP